MLTKVKEWIILNRDEKLEKYRSIFSISFLVVAAIAMFFKQYVLAMLIVLFKQLVEETYEAIMRQENRVIRNNKLRYIVLSDFSALTTYMAIFIIMPWVLYAVYKLEEINVIFIPFLIIVFIGIIDIAKSISEHFLEKLK